VLSASSFTYYFLEVYKKESLLKNIFKFVNVISLFFMVISLTHFEDTYPLYFGTGIDVFIVLANCLFVFVSIKKFKEMAAAKFYLLSWFFVFIAFTLGLTLNKHIDFKNLTLKEPFLDILYIIVFIISIYLIIKDYKKTPEK
jgi:hypothetical protein